MTDLNRLVDGNETQKSPIVHSQSQTAVAVSVQRTGDVCWHATAVDTCAFGSRRLRRFCMVQLLTRLMGSTKT